MKKLVFAIVATFIALGAQAQKGMWGVGADGFASYNSGEYGALTSGGCVKVQYNVTDYFRVEPHIGYASFSADEFGGLFVGSDCHLFFSEPKRCRPFAGLSLNYFNALEDGIGNGFFGKIGVGIDYRCTSNISLQFQISALIQSIETTIIGPGGSIGLAYNF